MKKLLLLAGEESGVLYAVRIAAKVRAMLPGVEIRGYGDYGFETGDLAVFGFWEVFRHLGYFLRVRRTMERAIDEWRPDVVCTIDYPGLNLRLAAHAKKRGIGTVHVVCPQVWAWHQGRIPRIEATLDRLCCFFPFEPAIFRKGLAEFVGHPLAGEFESAGRKESDGRLVAMLPGSRLVEIEKILPTLLAAAGRLSAAFPSVKFVIPAANAKARRRIDELTAGAAGVEVVDGGARELLKRAECAVVASGTATLEAALARCPTVLVYRVGTLFAIFLRHAIRGIRHVGLANIIAEKTGAECPMPELLQEDFTVSAVVDHVGKWLSDPVARDEAAARLDRTMALLRGGSDPIGRIAEIVVGRA